MQWRNRSICQTGPDEMLHSSTGWLSLEDKPDEDRLILGDLQTLTPTHQDLTQEGFGWETRTGGLFQSGLKLSCLILGKPALGPQEERKRAGEQSPSLKMAWAHAHWSPSQCPNHRGSWR